MAERHADGAATNAELRSAWDAAQSAVEGLSAAGRADAAFAAAVARACAGGPFSPESATDRHTLVEVPQLCDDLRDVFGTLPFRSVGLDPAWRTSTVVALAREMYGSRDFSTFPLLADALQDAGCDDEEILRHYRGGGPHARGCWVLDLVLGRA